MNLPSWVIFDTEYADVYDLTTRHREDEAEVEALAALAGKFCTPFARRILDIGCGTGRHTRKLAELGFDAVGLDPSSAMIRRALLSAEGTNFFCGTIEEFSEQDFRFAFSLGHVVNYIETDEELLSFFRGVYRALGGGAGYYFECWDPEATAADPPQCVVRETEEKSLRIRREVVPNLAGMPERVQLLYRMEIKPRDGGCSRILERPHNLRLFSKDLLEDTLRRSGFEGVDWSPAFTESPGKEPKFWGALSRKLG